MYVLYVIPGSHACRSAMLMLEHKQVPYRRIELVSLLHPILARLHGFDAGGQRRSVGGRRPVALRIADRLGTVPGLACDGQRVSTNHAIARFLDERHPQPPLFPAAPDQRAAVQAAERWANETLQMAARRIPGAAFVRDPAAFSRSAGDGRLGYLLYKRALTRRLIIPRLLRDVFAAGPAAERELLAELPAMLDRIDAWIADGVLGGAQLNAADFMVAPSLALILYRTDVMPLFEGRPALELVDRLLPELAWVRDAALRSRRLRDAGPGRDPATPRAEADGTNRLGRRR
jgi:glutathione S-transferase